MSKRRAAAPIDPAEQAHFAALSGQWWNPGGPLAALHAYNPARLAFITGAAREGLGRELGGLSILDVGCGGGILSEALAKAGAKVTGVDGTAEAIAAAKTHAAEQGLAIRYLCGDVAKHHNHSGYDVVIASEVVEHIDHPAGFIAACCSQLKPNGILIITTFNRTARSLLLGVFAAEALGFAPTGTHEWKKFLRPSDIALMLASHRLEVKGLRGARFSPLTRRMTLSNDLSVNYLLWAQRKAGRAATKVVPRVQPVRAKAVRQRK
jgi:2-polyprenyl-6-hydroxyphenyl methylase / 3-demethylubiquinone-9 3-methyltransferase